MSRGHRRALSARFQAKKISARHVWLKGSYCHIAAEPYHLFLSKYRSLGRRLTLILIANYCRGKLDDKNTVSIFRFSVQLHS